MALFNINRFHLFAMTFWLLAKFLTAQMMFPIFSNYVPKWRCTATQKFGNNCTLYEECANGVEFENNYFQSAGKFHSDIFNFICPFKRWNMAGYAGPPSTGELSTRNSNFLA